MSSILPFACGHHPACSPLANEIHAAVYDRVGLARVQGFVREWASDWVAQVNTAEAARQQEFARARQALHYPDDSTLHLIAANLPDDEQLKLKEALWEPESAELPLPPSHNSRSKTEKWAALAAVHDVFDLSGDKVLPWPLPEDDQDLVALTEWMRSEGGSYLVLMRAASKLTDTEADSVARWLVDVEKVGGPAAALPTVPSQGILHTASTKAGEALMRVMENDPDAKAALQRARDRLRAFATAMQEAMASPEYRAAQEAERQRWQGLADAIREAVQAAGDELESRHFVRPETIEDWEHLARIVEIPAETIKTGSLTAREIFACALAWADRQMGQAEPPEAASETKSPTKPKRSTERGDGQAKLIAALTKHHKYADGGCLHLESVGNNELARLAEVSGSTASAFFKKQFGGHTKYRATCSDVSRLVAALKVLNQEYSPYQLFDANPPGEDEE